MSAELEAICLNRPECDSKRLVMPGISAFLRRVYALHFHDQSKDFSGQVESVCFDEALTVTAVGGVATLSVVVATGC